MNTQSHVHRSTVQAAVERLMERCDALGSISESESGLSRPFCSDAMRRAHEALGSWMRESNMSVLLDAAGNLLGRTNSGSGDRPTLLIGSHLDTVVDAGKFDGALGVLIGIAVVEVVQELGTELPFEISVIGFSEEEGVRFNLPYIGSRAIIGLVDEQMLHARDGTGQTIAEVLTAFGGNGNDLTSARFNTESTLGFLEVHIEQGPVLESERLAVGAVSTIAGQTRARFCFRGVPAHAGTTPMNQRCDALAAAAQWILAVEHLAKSFDGLVATVGKISVAPNVSNVVPGNAEVTLDLRHPDDESRHSALEKLSKIATQSAQDRGASVEMSVSLDQPAIKMDPFLTKLIHDACKSQQGRSVSLDSGAGHDAAIVAQAIPTGMLFVRCRDGISHHPSEHVDSDDVAIALTVLLEAILNLQPSID